MLFYTFLVVLIYRLSVGLALQLRHIVVKRRA